MKHIVVAVCCVVMGLMISCTSEPIVPPRPALVPNTAVWAGGVDGGSFFECDVDKAHDVNRCLVYNDHTGDVEGGGFFRLSGSNRAARSGELRFRFFDGERIELAGGMLVPVQPVRNSIIPQGAIFANGLFIFCGKVLSGTTDCSIYRPDGAKYFHGTFAVKSATDKPGYKFFDLTDRTIYLTDGGALIATK